MNTDQRNETTGLLIGRKKRNSSPGSPILANPLACKSLPVLLGVSASLRLPIRADRPTKLYMSGMLGGLTVRRRGAGELLRKNKQGKLYTQRDVNCPVLPNIQGKNLLTHLPDSRTVAGNLAQERICSLILCKA
jgi:hypothetical protein